MGENLGPSQLFEIQRVEGSEDDITLTLANAMSGFVNHQKELKGKVLHWKLEGHALFYCGIESFHLQKEKTTYKLMPVILPGSFEPDRSYSLLWHAACLRDRKTEGLELSKAFKEELLALEFFPSLDGYYKSGSEANSLEEVLRYVASNNRDDINNVSFDFQSLFSKEDNHDPFLSNFIDHLNKLVIVRQNDKSVTWINKIGSKIFVTSAA